MQSMSLQASGSEYRLDRLTQTRGAIRAESHWLNVKKSDVHLQLKGNPTAKRGWA